MKKMLTLMGFGAFTLAASALTPGASLKLSDFHLDPAAQLKVEQIQKQNLSDIANGVQRDGVIKKTFSQGKNVWDIWVMNNNERWADILIYNDGTHPEFEAMPYYFVTLYVVAENADKPKDGYVTATMWPLMWPAKCVWDYSGLQGDGADWADLDTKMVDLDVLANDKTYCSSFMYDGTANWLLSDDRTQILNWPVGLQSWMDTTTGRIDGQEYSYPAATQSGTSVSPSTAVSTFVFKSYEAAEKYLEMDVTLQMVDSKNNAVRRIVPYTGKARVEGFAPARFDGKFGGVHIVNIDTQSAKINEKEDWSDPFDFEDWGPFQKYYVMAASPDYQIIDESAEYNDDQFGYGESLFVVPADGVTEIKDPFIIYGTLLNQFSTENPANFNQNYRWVEPEERPNPWNPKENTLLWDWYTNEGQVLPSGFNSDRFGWSDEDWALFCVSDGYGTYLQAPSCISIGTKNGFELFAHDNFGNTYSRSFNGNIVYHPDRKKMSQTVNVPSVGDLVDVKGIQATDEIGIIARNGEILVNASADTEVAVYALSGAVVVREYVKAGETVVVPVEKGIYVVKAGNEARKVVL